MPEKVWFANRGVKLAGLLYWPDGDGVQPPYPAVVVCHGLGSRKERHAEFAEFLSRHGLASLTIDLRGHGESDGSLDGNEVDDLAAAAEYLRGRSGIDGERLAVRGSSLGGFYAILAAASFPFFRAAVAVCPATGAGLRSALVEQGMPHLIDGDGLYARLKVPDYLQFLESRDVFEAVKQISPRALYLIHARGDETIPYQVSEALYRRAGEPKRLLLVDGGSHTSAQHDPTVHASVVEWLKVHLGVGG